MQLNLAQDLNPTFRSSALLLKPGEARPFVAYTCHGKIGHCMTKDLHFLKPIITNKHEDLLSYHSFGLPSAERVPSSVTSTLPDSSFSEEPSMVERIRKKRQAWQDKSRQLGKQEKGALSVYIISARVVVVKSEF